MRVSFSSYGDYSSGNYGVNALCLSFGNLDVYYSYTTPVAFSTPESGLVVIQNYWKTTTGKHLNWIDGGAKHKRVNREQFDELWAKYIEPLLP